MQRRAEARRDDVPTQDEHELHRLLALIEQLQRQGLSEREITAAVERVRGDESSLDSSVSPPDQRR